MKKVMAIVLFLAFAVPFANADRLPQLWNIVFNLNGTFYSASYCPADSADCGATPGQMVGALPGQLDTSQYDFNTGLGTLVLTFNTTGGGQQNVAALFDLEVDPIVWTQDFVDAHGTSAAGLTYQAGDLFNGNILDNVVNNALDGELLEPGDPADASVAFGWNFALGLEDTATLIFTFSQEAPAAGFYIDQWTTQPPRQDVYMTTSLAIERGGPEPSPVPEPASLILLASGLVGAWQVARYQGK